MEVSKGALIFGALFLLLIAFGMGYITGTKVTLDFGIKIFMKLIELKKINIDIDEQMLRDGLTQYRSNIKSCLFIE
jgi:hypothetical protein